MGKRGSNLKPKCEYYSDMRSIVWTADLSGGETKSYAMFDTNVPILGEERSQGHRAKRANIFKG